MITYNRYRDESIGFSHQTNKTVFLYAYEIVFKRTQAAFEATAHHKKNQSLKIVIFPRTASLLEEIRAVSIIFSGVPLGRVPVETHLRE